jgi:hypothetical protein
VLSIGIVAGVPVSRALPLVILGVVMATAHQTLLQWRNLVITLVAIVLFVPIRLYSMPGSLPFELEPYRALIAFVALGWLASLLVDPRVRLRRTVVDGPLVAILAASSASVLFNTTRIAEIDVAGEVSKQLTFLVSFVVVTYVVVSVIESERSAMVIVQALVAGGAVVAAFSVIELFTSFNVFQNVHRAIPFLDPTGPVETINRAGRLRVMGPAQHPIALGALFAILAPLGVYLHQATRRLAWMVATGMLVFGVFATASRTAILMLAVIGLVFIVLRPTESVRAMPFVLPVLVVIQLLMPGTLRTLYEGFFPKGGLVAAEAAGPVGSARIPSFHAGMAEVGKRPLLGGGFGSRIVTGPEKNSFIVDDAWLSLGMEVGVVGVLAWIWFFLRFIRRAGRAARSETGERGWFLVALTASIASFAVGMISYDALSFIQVTLVMFVIVALGSVVLEATSAHPGGRLRLISSQSTRA